jgi:nucleotide-binding universal stress UspA family protein
MINIKRILYPTDMTPHSVHALRYAAALANAHDAELVLFHCVDTEVTISESESPSKLLQAIDPVNRARLRWRALVSQADDVGAEISRKAVFEMADLIVMRSRRRPHRAALLGSTAESVCRSAPCSVVVLHNDERNRVRDGSRIELKRILVAHDFSDYSEIALQYALALAQEHQAELHLLHVLPPRSLSGPEIAWYPNAGAESPYHMAARRLQRVVPAEVHLWCKVRNIVSEGQPYREILSYAENNDVDLISVGAHGAGFGMRALFGSNVDRVLRQAPCPVLVARPLRHSINALSVTEEPTTAADERATWASIT